MARIIKTPLARGTSLNASHWNSNKTQVESVLSNGITTENLSNNNGKFSLTFNWPRLIAEDFTYSANGASGSVFAVETQGLNVPIILPPLQDQWTQQIGVSDMPKLKSISVGFDTYMNNYGVLTEANDPSVQSPENVIPTMAHKYALELEIREKLQAFHSYSALTAVKSQNIAPKSIYKASVGGETFNSDVARFNPTFLSGIDLLFHPQHTYLLKINFPELYNITAVTQRFAPVSLTVKLDFECRLVGKDSNCQNFPYGIANVPAVTSLDTAVAGLNITARDGIAGNGRVQRNLEAVDAIAVNGIKSGYDIRSNSPVESRIVEDASYFAMAVPMFNGCLDIRASDLNKVGHPFGPLGNYGGLNPAWTGVLADQRLIPISQPFTIHHILAIHDYGSHEVPVAAFPQRERTGVAMVPTSPTFRRRIGVGIASGMRSESRRYQQVAYLETLGPTKFNYLVDQVTDGLVPPDYGDMTLSDGPFAIPGYLCDQEIFSVPLVPNIPGGANQRGYFNQGNPFFVGQSNLATVDRTNVGNVVLPPAVPNTLGEELFLDLRWVMDDTGATGLSNALIPPALGPYASTQYVGTSKCWIYIIGKMVVAQ